MDTIEHFSHQHPLTFYSSDFLKNAKGIHYGWCKICGRDVNLSEGAYGCRKCCHFIDKSCMELPETLNHPFHQEHALTLMGKRLPGPLNLMCKACGFCPWSSGYECKECPFFLDIFCAFLSLKSGNKGGVHPIGQPHPLFICDKPARYVRKCSCCSLEFSATDEVNVCIECNNVLHQSCASVNEINHPFHIQHPLVVVPTSKLVKNIKCSACSIEHHTRGYLYLFQCKECDFTLDFRCADLVPVPPHEVQKSDLNHEHHLIESKVNNKFRYKCGNCDKHVKDSVFCCLDCGFLLDKECADLLLEIEHPCHPQHPFQLKKRDNKHSYECCWLCRSNSLTHFAYSCSCGFYLQPSCAITKPAIINKTEFHEHPLAYFSEYSNSYELRCKECYGYCWSEYIRCALCNYNCHLNCYLHLPLEIKHKGHSHPLILTSSKVEYDPIEDHDHNTGPEFRCNVCEKSRDLSDPTYCCKEGCHFVSHPSCAISEILLHIEKAPIQQTLDNVQDEKAIVETALSVEEGSSLKRENLELEEERDYSTGDESNTCTLEVSGKEEIVVALQEEAKIENNIKELIAEIEKLKARRAQLEKSTT